MLKARQEFEIIEATAMGPDEGMAIVVAGPGGSGKSSFLGSIASTGKTLLIATLAREVNSVMYQRYNPDVVLLEDKGWRPTLDRFDCDMMVRFLELMDVLQEDEIYDNVLLDSGTQLTEGGWHEALKTFRVASPADMKDTRARWLPYESLANMMWQAMNGLVGLKSAVRPKTVAVSWHVQPAKEDSEVSVDTGAQPAKKTKKSADHAAEGVEYEGKVLPAIRGAFRRQLINHVDAYVYTDLVETVVRDSSFRAAGKQLQYMIQVAPNSERHTKIPALLPPGITHIPNDYAAFLRLIKGEYTINDGEE